MQLRIINFATECQVLGLVCIELQVNTARDRFHFKNILYLVNFLWLGFILYYIKFGIAAFQSKQIVWNKPYKMYLFHTTI